MSQLRLVFLWCLLGSSCLGSSSGLWSLGILSLWLLWLQMPMRRCMEIMMRLLIMVGWSIMMDIVMGIKDVMVSH